MKVSNTFEEGLVVLLLDKSSGGMKCWDTASPLRGAWGQKRHRGTFAITDVTPSNLHPSQ